MNAVDELDVIQDGLTSPFWAWLHRYITQEWGPSGLTYQQAVRAAAASPTAVVELQKVLHTADAMLGLLNYPQSRANTLKGQAMRELAETRARGGV